MSERSEHLASLQDTRFLCVNERCRERNVPYQRTSRDSQQQCVRLSQYGDVEPTWFYACPSCGSPLFMTIPKMAKNKSLLIRRQQQALRWIRRNIYLSKRKKERRKRKWQDTVNDAIAHVQKS